jgi:hypothetical protein
MSTIQSGCGCGTNTTAGASSAEPCSCGCCNAPPVTREQRLAELRALRQTIDQELALLEHA